MKYFVFLDNSGMAPLVSGLADDAKSDITIIRADDLQCAFPPGFADNAVRWKTGANLPAEVNITGNDRVIIMADRPVDFAPLIGALCERAPAPPILLLTDKPAPFVDKNCPNISVINITESALNIVSDEWGRMVTRRKAHRLKEILSGAEKILILTQNDPDPDAIASGMAIQALLGVNSGIAPICTLGEVTRNENLAMTRMLRVAVRTIKPDDIPKFDKIVIVDAQPPYFPSGILDKPPVVIDHHPYPAEYEAEFKDVDVSCGATATMLSEYLDVAGVSINRRLATALLYGVITDTMLLGRDSSTRDFSAFSMLWPLANHSLLSGMSRPRLDPEELSYFIRAIKNRRLGDDFLFIWLGTVKREDIIARLADFALQIGDSAVSAVCGVYDGSVTISIRNIGSGPDAGKVSADLFSKWGSAGGRHSMAKAVFSFRKFKQAAGLSGMKEAGDYLFGYFNEYIREASAEDV